jgi:hypothetical protein
MSLQANRGSVVGAVDDMDSQYKVMGSCLRFLLLAAKRLVSMGFHDLPISRFHTIAFLFTAYNDIFEWSKKHRLKAGVKLSREHRRALTGVVDIAIKYGLRYPACLEHALLCEGYHGKLLRKDRPKALMKRCATAVIPPELRSNYVRACARWELRDITASPDMATVSHMFEQCGSPYEAQLVEERSSDLYAHVGGGSVGSSSRGSGRSSPRRSVGKVRRPNLSSSKSESNSVHSSRHVRVAGPGVHSVGQEDDEVGDIEDLSAHPAFMEVTTGSGTL